jgi:arsenate reductase (thioredoxin)
LVNVFRGSTLPNTTTELFTALRTFCETLRGIPRSSLFERHQVAAKQVGDWIRQRRSAGLTANVIVVCTGNSRRSILGSTLGNIAAAYYGMAGVRFFSGGTAPSAFNPRTIRALRDIGVQIDEQNAVAPPGPAGGLNPRYLVRWGRGTSDSIVEYSKRYDDASNPQQDFCAILVCTDADENCPVVSGASLRVSMPFDDPHEFDGLPSESAAYAERRDQIGRAMMLIMEP